MHPKKTLPLKCVWKLLQYRAIERRNVNHGTVRNPKATTTCQISCRLHLIQLLVKALVFSNRLFTRFCCRRSLCPRFVRKSQVVITWTDYDLTGCQLSPAFDVISK